MRIDDSKMTTPLKVATAFAFTILLCLPAGLVECATAQIGAAAGDWPMSGQNPAHTGAGTGSPVLEPSLIWKLTVANDSFENTYLEGWKIEVDHWTLPVVSNGVVYVGGSGWHSNSTGSDYFKHLTEWGGFYALNSTNGRVLWSFNGSYRVWVSPAVASGLVYTSFGRGELSALNDTNGLIVWNFTIGDGSWVASSPTIANDIIYVGWGNGNVFALNASTGQRVWNFTIGGIITAAPSIMAGIVYAGSQNGIIYALNSSIGSKIWSYSANGGITSPAIADGRVYFSSLDSNIYCLNSTTGKLLWRQAMGSQFSSDIAVAEGRVYISVRVDNQIGPLNVGSLAPGNLYALNATDGSTLWNYSTKAWSWAALSTPAFVGGIVYVGSGDYNLYAFNASSGAKLWNFEAEADKAVNSPVEANGVLYVTSADGPVYALGSLPAPTATSASSLSPSTLSPSPSVPEFPAWVILPLAMIAVLAAAVLVGRKKLAAIL